jgi:hypothetical protein
MILKNKFELVKDRVNITNLSQSEIAKMEVKNGPILIENVLKTQEDSTTHYTKNIVFKMVNSGNLSNFISVVKYPEYPFHVTYNKSTDKILINLFPFGVDTITAISPDPRNIYACLAYGICLKLFVNGGLEKIKTQYFGILVSYYTSMFLQMFGREFGLLGRYSRDINKLRFFIACYILIGFFGEEPKKAYVLAAKASLVDYRDFESKLSDYDFTKTEDFIKSLSDFEVFRGMTKYYFVSKMWKHMTIHFLPALEDFSRMISIFVASSVPGNTMLPRFISKYNETEYEKILEISKVVLR